MGPGLSKDWADCGLNKDFDRWNQCHDMNHNAESPNWSIMNPGTFQGWKNENFDRPDGITDCSSPIDVPIVFGGNIDIDIYAKKASLEENQTGMVFFDISTGNQKAAESMQDENLQGGQMDFSGNNNAQPTDMGNQPNMQDFGTSSDLQGYNPRNNDNEMFVSENITNNNNGFTSQSNVNDGDLFGDFNEPTDSNFQQQPSNGSDPFGN